MAAADSRTAACAPSRAIRLCAAGRRARRAAAAAAALSVALRAAAAAAPWLRRRRMTIPLELKLFAAALGVFHASEFGLACLFMRREVGWRCAFRAAAPRRPPAAAAPQAAGRLSLIHI